MDEMQRFFQSVLISATYCFTATCQYCSRCTVEVWESWNGLTHVPI